MSSSRKFAPLGHEGGNVEGQSRPRLKGVIFDVDGTLCEPQNYMFAEMREVLGITKSIDILDHIYSLPSPQQEEAMEAIRNIERKAMAVQKPQPGLEQLMDYLTEKGIRKGICTRNFDAPVTHLLSTFVPSHVFSPIITREFRPPKPDPSGILHIASQWATLDNWSMPTMSPAIAEPSVQAQPKDTLQYAEEHSNSEGGAILTSASARADSVNAPKGLEINVIMVGDSVDDMTAGYRAGAATVLLLNDANKHLESHPHTDLVVNRLDDLIQILEEGFESRDVSGP